MANAEFDPPRMGDDGEVKIGDGDNLGPVEIVKPPRPNFRPSPDLLAELDPDEEADQGGA